MGDGRSVRHGLVMGDIRGTGRVVAGNLQGRWGREAFPNAGTATRCGLVVQGTRSAWIWHGGKGFGLSCSNGTCHAYGGADWGPAAKAWRRQQGPQRMTRAGSNCCAEAIAHVAACHRVRKCLLSRRVAWVLIHSLLLVGWRARGRPTLRDRVGDSSTIPWTRLRQTWHILLL